MSKSNRPPLLPLQPHEHRIAEAVFTAAFERHFHACSDSAAVAHAVVAAAHAVRALRGEKDSDLSTERENRGMLEALGRAKGRR
jgi:hypothetical protein